MRYLFIILGCMQYIQLVLAKKLQDLQIIVEHKPDACTEFAVIGDAVNVEYTGMLSDGRIFDTSVREGRSPLQFRLGSGNIIKGWERGIHGMCLGERRKLVIPPHLGYGSKAVGNVIPPDSTLIFTVHLVGLEKKSIWSKLNGLSSFAIYPVCILVVLYHLYKKVATSTDGERKSDKRAGKKRR
eukprot:gene11900-13132_t